MEGLIDSGKETPDFLYKSLHIEDKEICKFLSYCTWFMKIQPNYTVLYFYFIDSLRCKQLFPMDVGIFDDQFLGY